MQVDKSVSQKTQTKMGLPLTKTKKQISMLKKSKIFPTEKLISVLKEPKIVTKIATKPQLMLVLPKIVTKPQLIVVLPLAKSKILKEIHDINLPRCLLDLILSFDKYFVNDLWSKFDSLIKNGDEKELKYLQKQYHLVRTNYVNTLVIILFENICFYNYLSMAKWFHITFQITPQEVKLNNNYIFRVACGKGHLSIVQWLHSTFQITHQEAKKMCQ